ncbi:MAG: AAA family ATPase [SAR324 cluster bacterium]|nr:AAA family ATPase [SAR324 cluster bacterium]
MQGTAVNERFEFKQELGRSDLGLLHLANDATSGELLAVKIFDDAVDLRSEEGLRFRSVVGRLRNLRHPHLVVPSETGIDRGVGYQVSTYFPSESLETFQSAGAWKISDAVALLRQIASGLSVLHREGVVHGNIKPANLLISREEDRIHAVLTDPARSLLRAVDYPLRDADTASYMAPEEAPWLDTAIDDRADLYRLGLIAYRLLTGSLPFAGSTAHQVLGRRLGEAPPSPRDLNGVVPQRLADVVLRLLARDPADRYQTARGLLADLESLDAGGGALALGETPDPLRHRIPLAGRGSARETALAALAKASMGQGSLVLFAGKAGLGKRSLFEQLCFSVEASGGLTLSARLPSADWCAPFQIPLDLLTDLVRKWEFVPASRRRDLLYRLRAQLGDSAALLTGLLPDLSAILPASDAPAPLPMERERPRILAALSQAFVALADQKHPLVLGIGSLEQADADSLDWLRYVYHLLPSTPMVVIAGLDSSKIGADHPLSFWLDKIAQRPATQWITLAPLTLNQVRESLLHRLGKPAGEDHEAHPHQRLSQWLHESWGGYPLSHDLALHCLLGRKLLVRHEGDGHERDGMAQAGWQVDWEGVHSARWPETMQDLIQARLDLLSEPLLVMAQAAAIHPAGFAWESLASLVAHLPPEMVMDQAESLVAEGILERSPIGLRFAHERVRAALYAGMSRPQKTQLHEIVAAGNEVRPATPRLSHLHGLVRHFERAGDARRTVEHGLAAAKEARRCHALHGASRGYEALLTLLGKDARSGAVYAALGDCQARLGRLSGAKAALSQALHHAPDDKNQANTLRMLAWVLDRQGEPEAALKQVEEGLNLTGETLPASPVGTALARIAATGSHRYRKVLRSVGGEAEEWMPAENHRTARLLEQAAIILARIAPERARLADEKLLRLVAGKVAPPVAARALIRLGEWEGHPDSELMADAQRLLAQRHFPHERAAWQAAAGRCHLNACDPARAREALSDALRQFRALGDALGEAEVLLTVLEIDRWQGPVEGLCRTAQALAALAEMLDDAGLTAIAAGWLAYGQALQGTREPAAAIATLRENAEQISRLGAEDRAAALILLAGELHLFTGNEAAALEILHRDPDLQQAAHGPGLSPGIRLQAALAEAHLAAALHLPEERALRRKAVRPLLRSLRTAEKAHPRLIPETGPVEAMSLLLQNEPQAALAAGKQYAPLLEERGLRFPLARLYYRIAEGLKTSGDTNSTNSWVEWGGKALTLFDALGAKLLTRSTRKLLDLPGPGAPEDAAGALTDPAVQAQSAWDGSLLGLLERISAPPDDAAPDRARAVLQIMVDAAEAERGALLLPGPDGSPQTHETIPAAAAAEDWINQWLVETVWRERKGQILEHYRPGNNGGDGWSGGRAQSVLCIPLGENDSMQGAVYLSSSVSRTVYGNAELYRVSAIARQAGAVLAVGRALEGIDAQRARFYSEAEHWRYLAEWSAHTAGLGSVEAMMRAWLRDIADPLGVYSAAVYWWNRADPTLRFGSFVALRRRSSAPEMTTSADLAAEGSPAREALERQTPTPLRINTNGAAQGDEAGLLAEMGVSHGAWLPLVHKGESFGAVLIGRNESWSGSGANELENLQAPLRLIAGALAQARLADDLTAENERIKAQESRLQASLIRAERVLPRSLRGGTGRDDSLALAEEERAVVVAGHLHGMARLSRMSKSAVFQELGVYYAELEHALSLHEGHLERISGADWLARFPLGAESGLWGALTLHQLMRAWREERPATGLPPITTGLGMHAGTWMEGLLETRDRTEAVLAGEAARVAQRLAEMSFTFRAGILVSNSLVEELPDPSRFEFRPLGSIRLHPASSRVAFSEVYTTRGDDARRSMGRHGALWGNALRLHQSGQWRESAVLLREYLVVMPHDRPARLLLRDCRRRMR